MIEFVLLFALGFLAAALVGLIVAPIVQRRVVSLTERRIRASVPLSVAEIRAEKDMARAAFAAENARLSVDLKHNRDRLTESVARGARLSNDLVAIRAEKLSAEQNIAERDASIRDLNAEVADRDARINTLTGHFTDATRLAEARKQEMAKRDDQINRLGTEIEELRIDVVTLDTEAENFKSQIRELRDERNGLRESLKDADATNRDLENRLKSTNERLAQNEEKLARTITALSDRENALDRRVAEVERFRQKNRELSEEIRAAKSALKDAANAARKAAVAGSSSGQVQKTRPELRAVERLTDDRPHSDDARYSNRDEAPTASSSNKRSAPDQETSPQQAQSVAVAKSSPSAAESKARDDKNLDQSETITLSHNEKIDRLRARQAALIERLLKADKGGNDAALRREIATVAAMMVELTVGRDGDRSRIHDILEGNEDPAQPGSEPSLAARARGMLAASQ